ncbi:hemerythrin domain-containing protein [Amycolatopsis sp. K13G38]|uniref:Hemerythrin domain-containing protein n=1 Tax=Amycolatopsis acididurans TaxID=2724524 RepID=A0ABX1JH82_9PSEU|nr:hemerythrin domain-containing protein [Amycolatopsis acididurans]NKQ57775.1 hemerythrin domain-containing protein [Amycolatopsis acididurans]
MCEYCGCQAVTAIAELTAEHDHVVALISRVRTSTGVAQMAELAREIAAVLGPHTVVEEQGLFPALAGEFAEHIDRLTAEHRRIESVLDEAAGGVPEDPDWPGRLLAALHVLREHILAEQDGVFPAALGFLSTDEWAAVDAARARAGSALPEKAASGG